MDIVSFSTLNQNDLEIFKKFTSKIKLVLSDCSEVVFLGILYWVHMNCLMKIC